jgi:hypothetical protein
LHFKLARGTHGNGVVLAETKKAAKSVLQAFYVMDQEGTNILLQEFVKESAGMDIRVFVVGGKIIASMKRQSLDDDFRSNLHQGGAGEKIKLTDEERKTALKAAKSMGLNLCGVDMMRSERMWGPITKAKKKKPYSVILEGNHEHRIKKVLDYEPHLEGIRYGISFRDLDFASRYSDVVEYDGGNPGVINVDGIDYSHYFVSGISGRALQSVHHGFALTQKRFKSSTCGHSHLFDYHVLRDSSD